MLQRIQPEVILALPRQRSVRLTQSEVHRGEDPHLLPRVDTRSARDRGENGGGLEPNTESSCYAGQDCGAAVTHLRAQVEEHPDALIVQCQVPHRVFVPVDKNKERTKKKGKK